MPNDTDRETAPSASETHSTCDDQTQSNDAPRILKLHPSITSSLPEEVASDATALKQALQSVKLHPNIVIALESTSADSHSENSQSRPLNAHPRPEKSSDVAKNVPDQ